MTSKFAGMTSSSIFFDVVLLSCHILLLVHVSCQYHHWSWSYGSFLLSGIDQKSRNWKYLCLSFALYRETDSSYGYQLWHGFLQGNVTKSCKMSEIQLLLFLSYYGETNREGKITPLPHPN